MFTVSAPAPKVRLPLILPVLLAGKVRELLPDKSVNGPLVALSQTKLSLPAVGVSVQAASAAWGQFVHNQIENRQAPKRYLGRSVENSMHASAMGSTSVPLAARNGQDRLRLPASAGHHQRSRHCFNVATVRNNR
ncbi:hypothetical protein D3C71_1073400 [compost metagenome]